MFRARRYRIFLVFAAILVLVVLHFTGSRDQTPIVQISPPADPRPPYSGPDIESDSGIDESSNPAIPVAPPSSSGQEQQNNRPLSSSSSSSSSSSPSEQDQDQDQAPSQHQQPSQDLPGDTTSSVDGPGSLAHEPSKDEDAPTIPKPRPGGNGHSEPHPDQKSPEQSTTIHWEKRPEQFPIDQETLIKLPTGDSKPLPTIQAKFDDESSADKMSRLKRQDAVKAAFQHAWNGYKANAMGHDEVKPVHGGYNDPFGGWGATLVDSLDTLWIMGLTEEFSIAVDYVKKIDFTTTTIKEIPIFETTIRYLGGLLSAYDLSGHKYHLLLEKAIELGEVLMGAFDTPNRMPELYYKWTPQVKSENRRGDSKAVLAELGSLSLEFTRLSQLTKDSKYYDAIARITNQLEALQDHTKIPGIWPLTLDASGCSKPSSHERGIPNRPSAGHAIHGGTPTNLTIPESHHRRQLQDDAQPAIYHEPSKTTADTKHPQKPNNKTPPQETCLGGLSSGGSRAQNFGLGALGDSTYEYLPKEYLLLGGRNEQYRDMYEKAMKTVRQHLVYRPMVQGDRDIRFLATARVTDDGNPELTYEGTHLTCFVGGMVALGARLFGIHDDLELGRQLTDGCVWAYESTQTGIMPEAFQLIPCEKVKSCKWDEAIYHRALDSRLHDQPKTKSASKRSPEPEKGNWHVKATGEEDEETTEDEKHKKVDHHDEEQEADDEDLVPSHQEYVAQRIKSERLPPGITKISHRNYILRPEAIESVFIMYRLTADRDWLEKGWAMFEAITKHTTTDQAHASVKDVTLESPQHIDSMQSFWLGETLKYFYLLFSDPSLVSLDDYVLTTEAHPFKLTGN